MNCPHCQSAFYSDPQTICVGDAADAQLKWFVRYECCPVCNKLILRLLDAEGIYQYSDRSLSELGAVADLLVGLRAVGSDTVVWPRRSTSRPHCPPEVPQNVADDYTEACLVLQDSPKASAALSRTCLQTLLREAAKVKPSDLFHEIQQVLDSGALPSYLADAVDAIRNIGNFAAHPIKSKVTGEILPVEAGAAEWNLDTLELLFDFYYVQPALLAAKKAALNAKLKEAGKPAMK